MVVGTVLGDQGGVVTISLQAQSVLTVLRAHRVCVLWNPSY